MLGLRHGLDADHIATIDAMTRLHARRGHHSARWCGTLFALGHGVVVMAIVGAVALASRRWQPPEWVAPLGAGISITLLAALGLANLHAVFTTTPGEMVALRGFKGRAFGRLQAAGHPAAAAAVGALFAASFDTISQAALFAVSGSAAGGPAHALALGAVFAAGMMLTDGSNGWWVARLISRADAFAARASRITALAVSVASLLVAGIGALRWAWPAADEWADGAAMWLGVAVLLAVATACLAARRGNATRMTAVSPWR